jgi:hypothetical protein
MSDFRPWHLLVATNMLLLAGLVWSNVQSATPDAEIIRAKSIEIVNDAGHVVAQLHVGEDGGGNIRLRNGAGEVRVKLGASDSGAGLLLMDQNTEPGASLTTRDSGPGLTLSKAGAAPVMIAP